MTRIQRCDVVVVGAGLAGLTAAWRLARAGADVQLLEASASVGGRVHGETLRAGGVLDTGAEFVGPGHRRLRALLGELGLRTIPARLDTAPVLWRLPDHAKTSRLPPIPLTDLWRLARGWRELRHLARVLDPDQPWSGPASEPLDATSLADWLSSRGVGRPGLQVTEALVGGFATTSTHTLSAAHAAWWIAAAGGLVPAFRSGHANLVAGGAHQLPQRLAARLGSAVRLDTPVTTVTEHARGVEVSTATGAQWEAGAAVVALPLPALRRLTLDPAPPAEWRTAVESLDYGHATKIAAGVVNAPPVKHRAVLGGDPLAIAWCHGRTVAGIATGPGPHDTAELADDLATAFGLHPGDLTDTAVTSWTNHPTSAAATSPTRPDNSPGTAPPCRPPAPTASATPVPTTAAGPTPWKAPSRPDMQRRPRSSADPGVSAPTSSDSTGLTTTAGTSRRIYVVAQ